MACTLVVSPDAAPQLEGDISQQLAATANLSSSQPPVVTLLPSNSFLFNFRQSSFIDIVQRQLYYYATLTDHTPLPSWLSFDGKELAFSGVAPTLSSFPQSWDVDLIASDVEGFAGTTASFTIAIGTQRLAFVPGKQTINITDGMQLRFDSLQHDLFRDGQAVDVDKLASVSTSELPEWLKFDASKLVLSGTVPDDAQEETITISATDRDGYNATALVTLSKQNIGSVFAGAIGTLTALPGHPFEYRFPNSLFSVDHPNVTVKMPALAEWLHFDASTRELSGNVPDNASATQLSMRLEVEGPAFAESQTQNFIVDIKAAETPSSTPLATRAIPSQTSTPSSGAVQESNTDHSLSGGVVATIAILSFLAALFLIAYSVLCCRRRKQRDGYERHATPTKHNISRPIVDSGTAELMAPTWEHGDVEKGVGMQGREAERASEPPPQIALELPPRTSNRRSKWLNRLSLRSLASSIGNGEDAIRADSNIPEWGADASAVYTPHDSFSVPTEMARVSRQESQTSPTKRAMRRLRERKRGQSQGGASAGLGIYAGGLMPRHSSKNSRSHKRGASSFGFTAAMDRSSQTSLSTRGTSLLSTKASDFPRPPTLTTLPMSTSISKSMPEDDEKHKSIRLVGRSDSVADQRSMKDKHESFIKSFITNRASTKLQSPLFAHGSRAPSSKQSGHTSNAPSSAGSVRQSRGSKDMLASYSASSSLEPQRTQGRGSKRLSQRLRSTFAPGFPKTVTCSTLGADDERAADTSGDWTTDESSSEDLQTQLALPRHKRNFVLPGEASPTPPPASIASRRASGARTTSGSPSSIEALRHKRRQRLGHGQRSSSPLATAVAVPIPDRNPLRIQGKTPPGSAVSKKSRLSEPLSLVSTDSITRARAERPRLVHTNSKRPISVEKVQRLSSLKAEAGTETDTQAGSEKWEDLDTGEGATDVEGAGLVPKAPSASKVSTVRSDVVVVCLEQLKSWHLLANGGRSCLPAITCISAGLLRHCAFHLRAHRRFAGAHANDDTEGLNRECGALVLVSSLDEQWRSARERSGSVHYSRGIADWDNVGSFVHSVPSRILPPLQPVGDTTLHVRSSASTYRSGNLTYPNTPPALWIIKPSRSATPILPPQQVSDSGHLLEESQSALQANKATFFFRLDREIEKVNTFYLQKEAELKLRLRTLLDKKRALQSRNTPATKLSSSYVTLNEGFRLFSSDLDKLQQFVEVNQTAFSKILKKVRHDHTLCRCLASSLTCDSGTKHWLTPCFNRDVISDLSDQATTGLLELQAWAEGEKLSYTPAVELENKVTPAGQDEEVETQVLQAINAGNTVLVREWATRTLNSEESTERISRIFLNSVTTASLEAQKVLYDTGAIDYNHSDEINERNCIHEAAVGGSTGVLTAAILHGANIHAPDIP
ncbi:ankyrin repeat protein nuc-2 [Hortaea werneckii]|nr:ankyrin repeat protein nuc-2 [Hortaea werneckii]